MTDRDKDEGENRPTHTVEPAADSYAREKTGGHEVEPPEERTDDEAGGGAKSTQRQE